MGRPDVRARIPGFAQSFCRLFMRPGEKTDNPTYTYQLVDMADKEVEKVVGDAMNSDDEVLAQLGYTQGTLIRQGRSYR